MKISVIKAEKARNMNRRSIKNFFGKNSFKIFVAKSRGDRQDMNLLIEMLNFELLQTLRFGFNKFSVIRNLRVGKLFLRHFYIKNIYISIVLFLSNHF